MVFARATSFLSSGKTDNSEHQIAGDAGSESALQREVTEAMAQDVEQEIDLEARRPPYIHVRFPTYCSSFLLVLCRLNSH